MQIAIQTNGFELTEGLRAHVERRIRFAFDWANFLVGKVAVRLSDLNGPRGGEDKRCVIQLAVAGASDVVIEDTQSDLYVAIDRAADRAGRSLARRVERQRTRRNGTSRRARLASSESVSASVAETDDALPSDSTH